MHGVLIAQGVRQGKSGTVSLQTVLFGLSVWEPVNRTPDNEAERSEHTASGVLNSKVRLGCANVRKRHIEAIPRDKNFSEGER